MLVESNSIRIFSMTISLFQLRQLQQTTGAVIKLPEDSQQTTATEVSIKIIGTFQASQVTQLSLCSYLCSKNCFRFVQFAQRRVQSIIQINRDSSNASSEYSNNPISDESNAQSANNLNEPSTNINGSTMSDDAVVASNTTTNSDDSVTGVEEKKSNDNEEQSNHLIEEHSNN